MATLASVPNSSWASYVDDAISAIEQAHRSDPAWDWTYPPDEGYAALAAACANPHLTPDEMSGAQQMHRKAQRNQPRVAGSRGPEGYRPRWVQYFNRRRNVWVITAYRGISGKTHRINQRNAASMLDSLFKEMLRSFQSDLTHEIVPSLDEWPHVSKALQACITNTILQPLVLTGKQVTLAVQNLAPLLTAAERRGVRVDIALCSTVDDIALAYADALLALGVDEAEVDLMLSGAPS